MTFGDLLEQRGKAIALRSHLITHIRITGSVEKPNEWLLEYTGESERNYLTNFEDTIHLMSILASGWKIDWMTLIDDYFHVQLWDTEKRHDPYRSVFVSKLPEVTLASAVLAAHIKNITFQMDQIKKGLTNQYESRI